MNKPFILLCGRSGSGKTSVALELVKKGLRQVDSYTTRPARYNNEQGHTFVSRQDFPFDDLVAYTFFNEEHYGATQTQCDYADIYVVDKKGIIELKERYQTDRKVITVLLNAPHDELIKRMYERGDSAEMVNSRFENDDIEFSGIEELADVIITNKDLNDTVEYIQGIYNSCLYDEKYQTQSLLIFDEIVKDIEQLKSEFAKLAKAVGKK